MKKIMFNDLYGLTEAVLSGRKTQTRRIVKMTPIDERYAYKENFPMGGRVAPVVIEAYSRYQIGEVVAVAQSYKDAGFNPDILQIPTSISNFIFEVPISCYPGWRNKMFIIPALMPHQIRIKNVRVERLNDISEDDCLAEGIYKDECATHFNGYAFETSKDQYGNLLAKKWYKTPREAYAALMDKILGRGVWCSNPFVFVYDFELGK